jgi:hypothetical protein
MGSRVILIGAIAVLAASPAAAQTTFTFKGYIKMDALHSSYNDGPVAFGSPLRDFHFPAAIPVGGDSDVFTNLDYHAKESRFALATHKKVGEKDLRAYVEMDFLNDAEISGDAVSKTAYSASANLIYSPIPELHFGVEVMRGWREIESGAKGSFDRFQFSAKYDFGFSMTTQAKEKP